MQASAVSAIGSCCQQLAGLSLVARMNDAPLVHVLTAQLSRLTAFECLRLIALTSQKQGQLAMAPDSTSTAAAQSH